jgi:hypothetical protein
VAYTAPTYDASGQTFAQLKTRGLSGHVKALTAAMTTQTPTFDANQNVGMLLNPNMADKVVERARNIVDNYLTGVSDKASTKTEIFDLQLAFGSIAAALGEIGVLVDAN